MDRVQKVKRPVKRTTEDETIELPAEPASDTSAAADMVAVINDVLGDGDVQ
jgi:hypothetical protein